MKEKYSVDENGYYGQFGGSYIPEMLHNNVENLKKNYLENFNLINSNDNSRTKLMNSELEKNRQAIIVLCQLIDDKNKSGALDKIKSIFS